MKNLVSLFSIITFFSVSTPVLAAPSACIRFGGKSFSNQFESAGTLYKVKDGYKVIYDGDDPLAAGATIATQVEIDTQVQCEGFEGKVYSSALTGSHRHPRVSGILPVFYPAGKCPVQSITIRILQPKCMFGSGCEELVVKESVSVLGSDLYWLDTVDDSLEAPCKKKSDTGSIKPSVNDNTSKRIPKVQLNDYSAKGGANIKQAQ